MHPSVHDLNESHIHQKIAFHLIITILFLFSSDREIGLILVAVLFLHSDLPQNVSPPSSPHRGAGLPRTDAEESFSLSGRRSSSDSNKASSGEVSPYDNNSPVLSDRLLCQCQGDSSPLSDRLFRVPEQYTLVSHVIGRPSDICRASTGKGELLS